MSHKQKILFIIVIVTSLGIAFLLGRISKSEASPHTTIKIISSEDLRENKDSTSNKEELKIRASSRGTKYYLPWCKSTFNEENTVFFTSIEEAEKAGYEKASDCLLDSN
jgi:hypothetical protein